jgi:hypothetical protein
LHYGRGCQRIATSAFWLQDRLPGALLIPIQALVTLSLADAIQYVKAVSIVIAFIAAVLIC